VKKILLLILLLTVFFYGYSRSDIDSLHNLLIERLENGDSSEATLNITYQLFEKTIGNTPLKAAEYAAYSMQIASHLQDSVLIARSKNLLGFSYLMQKNYFMATQLFFDAYSIFIKYNAQDDIAKTLLLWAKVYTEQNSIDIARQKVDKAMEIYRKIGDSTGVAEAYKVLGETNIFYDNYTAVEYFNKALAIFTKENDDYNTGIIFNLLAKAHLDMAKTDIAFDYASKSVTIFKNLHKNIQLAETYYILGQIFSYKHQYQQAVEYFNKALNIYKQNQFDAKIAITRYELAHIEFLKKNYSNAENLYNQALTYAKLYNDLDIKLKVYQDLKEINIYLNNTSKALQYSELYSQTLSDYYQDKSLKNFSSFEMNIETNRFDKELELVKIKSEKEKLQLAQEQYRRSKMFIIIIFVLVLLYLIFIYFRLRERRKTTQKLEKANEKLKKEIEERKNAELEAKSNEQRYKLLFSQSPIGILQFDEHLTITDINDRFANIFHSNPKDFKKKHLNIIFDRRTIKKINELMHNPKENMLITNSEIPTKKEVIYVAVTVKKYKIWTKLEEITAGVIIIQDFTEQRRVERLYKENILSKNKMFTIIPDDILLVDAEENITEMHFPDRPDKELKVTKLEHLFAEDIYNIFKTHIAKVENTKTYSQFFFTDGQDNFLVRIFPKDDIFLIIISRYKGELHNAGVIDNDIRQNTTGKEDYLKNLKVDIEKELLPIYQNIQRGLSFIMIKNFAEKIVKLGKKHDNKKIIDFGETLLDYVTSFNVMKVNEQLDNFPSFINQFMGFTSKI